VTLHRRANAWFEQQGLVAEAVQHALLAEDWERAADLTEHSGLSVAFQGQIDTVLGWFRNIPEPVILARPDLCTVHAALLNMSNQGVAAEARLRDAEQGIQPHMPPDQVRASLGLVATVRANLVRFSGDLEGCVALAQRALELLPEAKTSNRAAAKSQAVHAFLVSGDVTPVAEQEIRAALESVRAIGNLFSVLRSIFLLARLRVLQGRLHAAAAVYAEATQIAPEPGRFQTLVGSPAYYFGLGDLLREWNDLAVAEHHLMQGIALMSGRLTVDAEVAFLGYSALARLKQARADSRGANATLDTFLDMAHQRRFVAGLIARGMALQAQLRLAQGNLHAARQWANTSGLYCDDELSFRRESEYMILVRVWIANGRDNSDQDMVQSALPLLDRLLRAAEASGRVGSVIEAYILRALALHVRGDRTKALTALDRALNLAEPEGYIRIFVDEGPPMADLLREAHAHGIMPEYVARLLSAFPGDRQPTLQPSSSVRRPLSLVEPLTEREQEVLRLIAAGRSNAEIAQTLVVAVSTIKTHINRIFGKLGATSRTQAVARARELHLL
jgi:LuxR family transcriptional regulator, maltose regulon positive regulatory protein